MQFSSESAQNYPDVSDESHETKQKSKSNLNLSEKCQIINLCDGQIPALQKGLKFMHLNIRSLISKLDSLSYLLYQ